MPFPIAGGNISKLAYDQSQEAKVKSEQALEKSTKAEEDSSTALTEATTVRDEFDRVVAEAGENNPEVVQARGNEVNLNARLNKTDEQLAQKVDNETYTQDISSINNSVEKSNNRLDEATIRINGENSQSVTINKNVQPTFTIIDDDTRAELYSLLYPAIVHHNIPITSSLISSRIGNRPAEHTITYEQFLEMKNSGLVEFVNHTRDHLRLGDLSDAEIDEQIRDCQEWLRKEGIYTSHIVYPFGSVDDRVRRIAQRYVESGVKSDGNINNPYVSVMDSYLVSRIDFKDSIQSIKAKIDEAVEKRSWIIIATHAHYPHPSVAPDDLTFDIVKFNEMIEYAKSKNIRFRNYSSAYNDFKNLLELRVNNALLAGMSATGFRVGFGDMTVDNTMSPASTTPPTEFPAGRETVRRINSSLATSGGWPSAGTLITMRPDASDSYTYQIFHPIRSAEVLKRSWNTSTNSWTPLTKISAV